MNTLKTSIHATIRRNDGGLYVGTCDEIAIRVHGATLEEAFVLLKDAILYHLRDASVSDVTVNPRSRLRVQLELDLTPELAASRR